MHIFVRVCEREKERDLIFLFYSFSFFLAFIYFFLAFSFLFFLSLSPSSANNLLFSFCSLSLFHFFPHVCKSHSYSSGGKPIGFAVSSAFLILLLLNAICFEYPGNRLNIYSPMMLSSPQRDAIVLLSKANMQQFLLRHSFAES